MTLPGRHNHAPKHQSTWEAGSALERAEQKTVCPQRSPAYVLPGLPKRLTGLDTSLSQTTPCTQKTSMSGEQQGQTPPSQTMFLYAGNFIYLFVRGSSQSLTGAPSRRRKQTRAGHTQRLHSPVGSQRLKKRSEWVELEQNPSREPDGLGGGTCPVLAPGACTVPPQLSWGIDPPWLQQAPPPLPLKHPLLPCDPDGVGAVPSVLLGLPSCHRRVPIDATSVDKEVLVHLHDGCTGRSGRGQSKHGGKRSVVTALLRGCCYWFWW